VNQLWLAPVVEGHAETAAVGILLRRIGAELFNGAVIQVAPATRIPRSRLDISSEVVRAIDIAQIRLMHGGVGKNPGGVLILVDTDPDRRPPCEAVQGMLRAHAAHRNHLDVACVLAHPEWETWFVAAAGSLGDFLDLPEDIPKDPEASRSAKGWIKRHFRGHYSETVDQPKLTARMDLHLCRRRSPSFDKLCREIEKRLPDRPTE
jgi:Domain of unknown function (DUF4276)